MKRLRSSRTQSLLLNRFLLRRRSQLSGGEFRALEAERHAQRLGIAEVISSNMLGGASQTVSKIRVKCNGT